MTSRSLSLAPLHGRDLAEYGIVRVRDQAFDAVQRLWRKRRQAGVTQKDLATAIGRDPGWVSKNLRAPGNWTLRTFGEMAQALGGEVEINVIPLEEPQENPSSFDAYLYYWPQAGSERGTMFISTLPNPVIATVSIVQEGTQEILAGAPQFSVEVTTQ